MQDSGCCVLSAYRRLTNLAVFELVLSVSGQKNGRFDNKSAFFIICCTRTAYAALLFCAVPSGFGYFLLAMRLQNALLDKVKALLFEVINNGTGWCCGALEHGVAALSPVS